MLSEDANSAVSSQPIIVKIQNELFQLGSLLACTNPLVKNKLPTISEIHVTFLENEIDLLEKDLLPLKNFILPGGGKLASYTHVARAVCRRAEREIFNLMELGEEATDSVILRYINRLSDFLFVLSRWFNHKNHYDEQIWKT
jgi:cob(I)alamin adenosyltransferase